MLEARAAAVANQTALDQAATADAQQQAVERINKIIELNWKTNLVLKYAQDRDWNDLIYWPPEIHVKKAFTFFTKALCV